MTGKLIAFADDVLMIADSADEASEFVKAMSDLANYNLVLNKDKSVALTDRTDMKDVKEIDGIPVKKKVKYLGLNVVCDRTELVKNAKDTCRKYLFHIKGKIKANCPELTRLIHSAFYRSLIIYHFAPLLGAGVVSKQDILKYETNLMRKQLLLPNDIKSEVIFNIGSFFITSAADVTSRVAYNQRLNMKVSDKVP